MQPKYRFYATILDAFWGYLNSDVIWDKYWGWSENPPYTPEEFHEQQFQELIDRINRKPFDNEKADRGTCFNELVDALIENRKPKDIIVERTADGLSYQATYNNRGIYFSYLYLPRVCQLLQRCSNSATSRSNPSYHIR